MKRILALILAILMLSAVFVGCTSDPNGDENANDNESNTNDENGDVAGAVTFEAGFGREKIDVDLPFKLAGDNNDRPTSGFYDDLYVTAASVRSSDGTTVIILGVDAAEFTSSTTGPIREEISAATNVPVSNIIMNFSHSHFTPHFEPTTEGGKAFEALKKASLNAAKVAMADIAPATIYTGKIETEGMTSTRRFVDLNNNGKIELSRNEIENPVDQNLYVINFDREGKKDVVLANFASHSTVSSGTNNQASSSYYGPCRDAFEKTNDAYLCLLQGAAGNSIPKAWVESKTPGPNNNYLQFDPKFIGSDKYGEKLAQYISDCLEKNMKEQVSDKGVRVLAKDLSIVVDNTRAADASHAQEILNEWGTNGVNGKTQKYNELCEKYNIRNTYEAYKIVACNNMGGYTKMEISAIAIGNIGIAAAGYEMLSVTGDEIFAGSPFDFTFVLGYTNDCYGYIPQEAAFDVGGYEVYSCRFVKGTAEKIRDQALKSLNKLYQGK